MPNRQPLDNVILTTRRHRNFQHAVGQYLLHNSTTYTLKVTDRTGDQKLDVELVPGQEMLIGRWPTNPIPVSWDLEISREHATVLLNNGSVSVAVLDRARNPIQIGRTPVRVATVFPGQRFQIGQTVFQLEEPAGDESSVGPEDADDADIDTFQFSSKELQEVQFSNNARQMELLCDLPDVIATATSDADLGQLIAGLLLDAIPESVAVAVAQYDDSTVDILGDQDPLAPLDQRPQMMRVRTRDGYEGRFLPSRMLVGQAFRSNSPTVHIWGTREETGQFTLSDDLNWAFCVPVPGAASKGWCMYVAGKGGKDGALLISKDDLKGDVQFGHLLAQFIASIRHVKSLQDAQTQMATFFSPKIMENLTGGSDVLKPAEREITVLFCDVRGFSRKAEIYADNLHYLLECVKEALGAMTNGILKYDGAVADFQGDAALGFWGWPLPLNDGAVSACLAALLIQDLFAKPPEEQGLLEGFGIGLGIAHGRAIAGQIGTVQQAKIGVFGPIVNQGARLESMTKQYGVQICIDEQTAAFVRNHLPPERARVRRLACVRPKGMDTPITVSELVQPLSKAPHLPDEQITQYEAALDLVISGDWTAALAAFAEYPDEGPKTFLLDWMKRYDNKPPQDWDGGFSLVAK